MSNPMWEEIRLQSLNSLRTLKYTVDSMARLPGARVILLASSGFLSGTLESDQDQNRDRSLNKHPLEFMEPYD